MPEQKTALHAKHEYLGAHFARVGDWLIPDYYESVESEYEAIHNTAALHDCCHEGRIRVSGMDMLAFLNRIATTDIEDIPINMLRDTLILNERGGIIDTIVLFRADKFCTIHTNNLVRERVLEWFNERAKEFKDVKITDSTTAQGCIELRGPMARSILETAILDGKIPKDINSSVIVQVGQARCLVTFRRSMGIDMFRIETGGLYIEQVWDRMMAIGGPRGMLPAGWRVQEIVRVESGVSGVGAEIDENTTPFEVGSTMQVSFQKADFVGRRAVLHSTIREFARKLVSLRFETDTPPVPGDSIEIDDVPFGYVTSAVYSPGSQVVKALGFVDAVRSSRGTVVHVRSRGKVMTATIADG